MGGWECGMRGCVRRRCRVCYERKIDLFMGMRWMDGNPLLSEMRRVRRSASHFSQDALCVTHKFALS